MVKQIACNPGRLGRIKIALLVSHEEALSDVHRITLEQHFDHPRLWLAASTRGPISSNETLGVMGAKFERIDVSADGREITRHPFVQTPNVALFVKPASNPRLVGDDKRKITSVIDGLYGPPSSFHPAKFVRIKDVAIVLIENTITIKKYGRAHKIP